MKKVAKVSKKNRSSNRITLTHHRHVVWLGMCPHCFNHRIVKVPRVSQQEDGTVRFAGNYYACGGDKGHLCWNMTGSETAKQLYEIFGEVKSSVN